MIIYLIQYIQNNTISTRNQYLKSINETFNLFFILSLQNLVCILHFLNLDARFSFKKLALHLDFIKFTFAKDDSHTQVSPNILKSFPVTELRICV